MVALDSRGRDVLPRVRKSRAVLALLALAAPRPVLREELIQLLWSRRGRAQALASLRQSVHALQDVLMTLGDDLLRGTRAHLALDPDQIWVDVRALNTRQDRELSLVRGSLLQDLEGLDPEFDRRLQIERERVAGLARAAGEQVLAGAAGPDAAIAAANRLITVNPADEVAWRALMTAHAARGEPSAVALSFDRCGAALAGATGQPPSAETQALFDRLQGREEVAASSVPNAGRPASSGVRLGVMPFRALDGAGEDPLSLGLAEEITTALSRFRWISCIASTSLAQLVGEQPGTAPWWEKVELDFLLDGTVQRASGRVRVNVRLLDMHAGGEVVWARRFDRETSDLLSLQDEVAAETVAQLDPELLLREGNRAGSRAAADPTAYDLTLRAIPAVYRLDRKGYNAAGELLASAVAADPMNAAAHAWWAYWHLFLVGQGWADDPTAAMGLAEELAEKAVILDPADARALTLAGHVRAFLHRRVDEALALHEQALSLNPNLALAWIFSSFACTYGGRSEEGLNRARQAKRLAPLDPHGFMADAALMLAHLVRREFEAVADLGRRSVGVTPGFTTNWKLLVSALGHLRRGEEAAAALAQLLRLEPKFTIREALDRCPLLRPEDLETYGEGLRIAGLRE